MAIGRPPENDYCVSTVDVEMGFYAMTMGENFDSSRAAYQLALKIFFLAHCYGSVLTQE